MIGTFSGGLSFTDRQRLREIVKRVHLKDYPADRVDDYEADKLIDALGPEVGQGLIERALQRGFLT
jgi:hypothetical protein